MTARQRHTQQVPTYRVLIGVAGEVLREARAVVERTDALHGVIAGGAVIQALRQQIGRHCVLAAMVGIAGSAVLKDHVIFGGHGGVRDNVTVGAGVRVAGVTAVLQDVPDGMEVLGTPALEAQRQLRVWRLTAKLPELRDRVRRLEERLSQLESSADH